MKGFHEARALIRARLDEEIGTIRREAPRRVALVYPSPYHVAMSSLGYQAIYGMHERASTAGRPSAPSSPTTSRRGGSARLPLVTYEGETPVGDFPRHRLLGRLRARADRPVRLPRARRAAAARRTSATARASAHRRRRAAHLLQPAAARRRSSTWCVMGEAEELVADAARRRRRRARSRSAARRAGARSHGFWVPSLHGERLPPVAKADDALAARALAGPHAATPSCARCSSSSRSAAARAAAPTA